MRLSCLSTLAALPLFWRKRSGGSGNGIVRLLVKLAVASMLLPGPAQAQSQQGVPAEEKGVASLYSWKQQGRRMANGRRFNALGATAASRTLPLGSRVRVTNIDNGRSTIVEIEDRGPFIRGRIMDLSLGAARRLGMTKQGLARVQIVPISRR
jgi:rare lipoprotein A